MILCCDDFDRGACGWVKLTTRSVAAPFEEKPAPGSMDQALNRLSRHTEARYLQFEMWSTYKPEQDRPGFSEKDIRAFGVLWDLQDEEQWEHGQKGWHRIGIDPLWYGRRYSDGHTDGFQPVPDSFQRLCYNESDDKSNWLYFRLLFDMERREYVELQSGRRTFDLRGLAPTPADPYANIGELLNASVRIETDTDRREFLFVDSVVISAG